MNSLRKSIRESLYSKVISRAGGVGSSVVAKNANGKYASLLLKDISQIYMLVEDDCPGCVEAKEEFAEDIADGTIKLLHVDDELGFKFVNDLKIEGVPAIVIELTDGRYYEFKND